MTERHAEPIFCSECQEEVRPENARILDGAILCRKDLASKGFFARLRARRLGETAHRRSGKVFTGFFTSLAMLMLVVGIAFAWKQDAPAGEGAAANTFVWRQGEATYQVSADVVFAARQQNLMVGVSLIIASIFTAFFGLFAGDTLDTLIDVFEQLRRSGRRP
jgi:hypothetical protein